MKASPQRCLAGVAVAAAVIYGSDAEQAGSVALVFRDCTRAHAYELMAQLESLCLMIGDPLLSWLLHLPTDNMYRCLYI